MVTIILPLFHVRGPGRQSMEEEYIFLAGTSAQWSKASNTIARWCNARFEDLSSSYSRFIPGSDQLAVRLGGERERGQTKEREQKRHES
jgi:hypothetical protein